MCNELVFAVPHGSIACTFGMLVMKPQTASQVEFVVIVSIRAFLEGPMKAVAPLKV